MESKTNIVIQGSYGPALLLKIPEVALRLNIGKTSVYELVRSGQLESVKIGKSIRIPTASLAKFVDALIEGVN